MKCPKCGNDMVLGELANARGDFSCYWAPKSFFEKHMTNRYFHTKKTIEREDGIIIKTNSTIQKTSACYGCKECKMIVIDAD